MAFGKGKQPQSYGVPVRSAVPVSAPDGPSIAPPMAQYAAAGHAPAAPWSAAAVLPYSAPPMQPSTGDFYSPPPAPAADWSKPASTLPTGFYPPGQGTAPNPFAPPPAWSPDASAYQQQQYLAPFAPAPKAAGLQLRKPFKIAAGVIAALFVAGAVSNFQERRRPPTLPATLGGRPMSTDPAVRESANKNLRSSDGSKMSGAVYTSTDGFPEIVLVARRGGTDMSRQIRQLESEGLSPDGAAQKFGGVTCFSVTASQMAVCLWSARVSGVVMLFQTDDMAAAASIAQEAKSALN